MLSAASQAWQSWKSARAAAFLIIVAFTIGIGSATAIYTIVNALLLKPVPYAHGDRWVSFTGGTPLDSDSMSGLSLDDMLEYQQRTRSFDVFGWVKFSHYNLTAPGQPQFVQGVAVTPALANGIGVNPRFGQWFRGADEPLAVISDSLWQRLGADPLLVGKSITLSGRIYTIAGIMPPGFSLPLAGVPYSDAQVDVWVALDPLDPKRNRTWGDNLGLARLRPGVTVAQADAEAKRIAAEIAHRESRSSYSARADNLHWLVTKDVRPLLLLLFGAAELLLLITCANVGGLLLARSVARARETAVRVALGAGVRQLASHYFLEGFAVALPGAAGGILLSVALVRVLVSLAGSAGARAGQITMDWRVCLFALATAILAGALAGIAPLWQAARTAPNEVLSEGVRASAGARSRRLSQSLVVAEVALAFVLLATSAVLAAEFFRLTRIAPGFDPEHLLTFQLTFSPEEIPGKASRASYQDRLVRAIQAIPGVTGAAFANQLPLKGCCISTAIFPEGVSSHPSRGERVAFLPISLDYFRTMRIPLVRGRLLTEHDTSEKLLSAVVNQATVKRYWPDRDPIGAFGHFGSPTGDRFQVLGVVADVKNNGLDQDTVPEIYLNAAIDVPLNPMVFAVRSQLPEKTLVPAVRRAIQNVNPGQPIHDVQMMSRIARDSVVLKRMASYVMTFFALAALLMASIGTYGVVSYGVRQRTVELGTRVALGAVSRDLLALVLGSGLRMAGYGAAIGAVVAIALSWLGLRQFGIHHPGVLPFVFSAATIAAVAMAASFFPAWGATLLSPMVAIRNQPGSMWDTARHGAAQLFEGWFGAGSDGADRALPPEASLMAEFVEASRRAASFREALRAALESLRRSTSAQSALLLESDSTGEFRATLALPEQPAPACSIPQTGLLANRLRFHSMPLPISPEDLDVWRRWAQEFKPQHLPEIETLRKCDARLAVPLRTNREILGVLLLGPPAAGEFSDTGKLLLRDCANHLALMLENGRLTSRIVEHERLQRDLALAAEVQKHLLPRHSLDTPVAALAALSLPARSVGGDYYDFLDLPGRRTAIALADVAGKGVAAALIMSVVQASLRVIASEPGISLPQLAARLNHFIYRSTGTNSYATFFYAQLDESTRELRYVNAGHNPPYLLRADAARMTVEELTAGGTVIGLFPQARYEEGAVELRPGDVLAVFTDGVPEALNPSGEEFGEERLKTLLGELLHLPVEEMSSRISQALKNWIRDAAQYDDLTYVLMKVK